MRIKINKALINLPDFLIIGVPKSGTTSLYHYLDKNPEISMSKFKEPCFFQYMGKPPFHKSPNKLKTIPFLEDYLKLFKENKCLGEASPFYFYSYKNVIRNIKKIYGKEYKKLKIIVLLRNPVERAYSGYNHFLRQMQEPLSFEQAIKLDVIKKRIKENWNPFYDYIGLSLYSKPLIDYIKFFPNIRVFFFEEIKENPKKLIKEVSNFLEVKPFYDFDLEVYNKGGVFNPKLNFLIPFYKYLLNRDHISKKIIRKLMPNRIRLALNEKIRNFFLIKSNKLDKKQKRILMEKYFKEDIIKLKEILPKKKNYFNNWLKENN